MLESASHFVLEWKRGVKSQIIRHATEKGNYLRKPILRPNIEMQRVMKSGGNKWTSMCEGKRDPYMAMDKERKVRKCNKGKYIDLISDKSGTSSLIGEDEKLVHIAEKRGGSKRSSEFVK